MVKKIHVLRKLEVSLPCSQKLATDSYLEPPKSSPHPHILFLHHCVETGSGAHPFSYATNMVGSLNRHKAVGTEQSNMIVKPRVSGTFPTLPVEWCLDTATIFT